MASRRILRKSAGLNLAVMGQSSSGSDSMTLPNLSNLRCNVLRDAVNPVQAGKEILGE